jgi:hypothetical protein
MKINMATYTVRDAFGSPDRQETLNKFAADFDNYVAESETAEDVISAAADSVFDELKASGTRANKPYVVSAILQRLNVSAHPASYNMLAARVGAFLTNNSQAKAGDKSLFIISKGKSTTGVLRRSDVVATDSK